MSAARGDILGALATRLDRKNDGGAGKKAVAERLAAHRANLIPERGRLPDAERIALFEHMALEADATVARVADADAVPAAVAEYLRAQNLPARARRAPDSRLDAIPWDKQPALELWPGPAEPADEVSVTAAFGAVAETGTLMLASGPDHPTTLNFLPETHIVVLWAGQVSAAFEDQWTALRQRMGNGTLPRAVNFVTGPSRSADIEQTLQLGAHGPRRLHIVIVDEPEPKAAG